MTTTLKALLTMHSELDAILPPAATGEAVPVPSGEATPFDRQIERRQLFLDADCDSGFEAGAEYSVLRGRVAEWEKRWVV